MYGKVWLQKYFGDLQMKSQPVRYLWVHTEKVCASPLTLLNNRNKNLMVPGYQTDPKQKQKQFVLQNIESSAT